MIAQKNTKSTIRENQNEKRLFAIYMSVFISVLLCFLRVALKKATQNQAALLFKNETAANRRYVLSSDLL